MICQNSPLLLKNLQRRDSLSQSCCLSSLALSVLLFYDFIQSSSMHSFNTHRPLWQGISEMNKIFSCFVCCEAATSYLNLKFLGSVWLETVGNYFQEALWASHKNLYSLYTTLSLFPLFIPEEPHPVQSTLVCNLHPTIDYLSYCSLALF